MIAFELLVVLGLVLLNGFFAMSELAVVSARRARLQQLADSGRAGAKAALALQAEPTRFLSTVQVGITLIGVLAGAYSSATLAHLLAAALVDSGMAARLADTVALAVVVVAITYLSLVLGELVPKRLALGDAAGIASRVALPMRVLSLVGAPLVWILEGSTNAILRLLGIRTDQRAEVTEEEIRTLIAEGAEAGVLHRAEQDMIEGVMRLADRPVRAVMTPRVEVAWLDIEAPVEEVRDTIARSGHSRFLVGRGGLDELVGVVQTKDLAIALLRGQSTDLGPLVREPIIVPESTPVLRLLERFRTAPVHLAVVVDEYGSLEGIVTPRDILTAIAGALPEGLEEDNPDAVRRDDGSWLVDGRMGTDEVERTLGVAGIADDGSYTTLAGFMLARMGRLPKAGDWFRWEGHRFEVVDMDGRRIDKVLVVPPRRR
ncbi:MAG: hemolysin family protein [Geminicoccaceae bacterium]